MTDTGTEQVKQRESVTLLPCPFCGEDQPSLNEPSQHWPRGTINCPGCMAMLPGEIGGPAREQELVNCWNTRVPKWEPVEVDGEFDVPMDTEVLLGWFVEWPERRWQVAAGLYGSTKGGWVHGQATHWQPLPAPPSNGR